VLAKGYEAKAFEAQRDLLLNQVDTLKARINIKDGTILNLNGQISDHKEIIKSKDAIISTQGEQRKIFEANTAALSLQLKRQKRKTKLVSFVGLLTTGLVTYLFISK